MESFSPQSHWIDPWSLYPVTYGWAQVLLGTVMGVNLHCQYPYTQVQLMHTFGMLVTQKHIWAEMFHYEKKSSIYAYFLCCLISFSSPNPFISSPKLLISIPIILMSVSHVALTFPIALHYEEHSSNSGEQEKSEGQYSCLTATPYKSQKSLLIQLEHPPEAVSNKSDYSWTAIYFFFIIYSLQSLILMPLSQYPISRRT